jgi:hypothetical protein
MISSMRPQSRFSPAPYDLARAALVKWGALMVLIYVVFLIFFPLVPTIDRHERVLDIEILLRDGREWFGPLYVLGLFMLFFAFWRVLRAVHRLSQEDPRGAKSLRIRVLGVGVLCSVILIGLYPITAIDVVLYVVRARLWALYDGSPMLALPENYPQDPYIQLGGEYQDEVSPYGPAWELIAQIPIRLRVQDIADGVIAMKLISLLSYVGMSVLVGWVAHQDTPVLDVSGLTTLTFFALNPLVLLEAIGNGHNDMLMLAWMTLGLVMWQRGRWAWAAVALTLAALVKITGLILLPLFGMAVLATAPNWRTRLLRGAGMVAIFTVTSAVAYLVTGPFPDVLEGARHAMFGRSGYTPAYALRVLLREFYQDETAIRVVINDVSRAIFVLYYAYLLVRLAQGKMTLVQAGFLAYFSQLMLGSTFRIWYPMWLLPFAAMGLNSGTYWRTFLFSITAELSILMYMLLWRWKLDTWEWGLNGPLKEYWDYWLVMTLLTAPWVFGIPFLVPLLLKRRDARRFHESLWI